MGIELNRYKGFDLTRLLVGEDSVYNLNRFFEVNWKSYPIFSRLYRFLCVQLSHLCPLRLIFKTGTGKILIVQRNCLNPLTLGQ